MKKTDNMRVVGYIWEEAKVQEQPLLSLVTAWKSPQSGSSALKQATSTSTFFLIYHLQYLYHSKLRTYVTEKAYWNNTEDSLTQQLNSLAAIPEQPGSGHMSMCTATMRWADCLQQHVLYAHTCTRCTASLNPEIINDQKNMKAHIWYVQTDWTAYKNK